MKPATALLAAALLPFAALASTTGSPSAPPTTGRTHTRIDGGWKFLLEKPTAPTGDIKQWSMHELGATFDTESPTLPGMSAQMPMSKVKPGDDVFHGRRGFAIFQTTLEHDFTKDPKGIHVLHFESVDDNATVYLNGMRILHHEGWNEPFDVPLDSWKPGQPNRLVVLVENTDGAGGIGATSFQTINADTAPKQAKFKFNDSSWRTVHLPHDFMIEGKFSEQEDAGHGALPKGTAWYRKTLTIPASAKGKSVWIDFDGAYSDAHVWYNGHFLGAHRSGYTGFRYDIAQFTHFGAPNVIAVHVDSHKTEGWWYEGGGLYRHVWLTIADPAHVSPFGGIYVRSEVGAKAAQITTARITTTVEVDNTFATEKVLHIRNRFYRPDGSLVSGSNAMVRLIGKQTASITSTTDDPRPALWSLEKPQLYTLQTDVLRDGKVVDTVKTPFGVRSIRFDAAKGFFLNNKPVKLKGTCNHQDFIGVGTGMPDSVLVWRIKKLKAMGSNAYRCSHNEVASELLDACDRLGMLVMDENREFGDTWSGKANERTTTNDLSDLRQEILRDRNHPSIILWSIANEEFSVQATPAGARIGQILRNEVESLDNTRLVTAALNGGHDKNLSRVLPLEGFNYGPWEYERYHAAHPDHPMFGSETASTVSDRGIYANDKVHGYVTGYDTEGTDTAERAWEPIAREPYNAGGFVWTGFDYKGEPTPYGWPCVNSHFGIMDMCGFPKDNWYYYKAWWGDKPLVHLLPHWDWKGQEGKPIDVWAYSNGDEVELFLNGQSLGRKANPAYEHLSWKVPYAPGRLVAKAYAHGKLIATDVVETTTPAVALNVVTDRLTLTADSEDCTMLEVSVVDAKGRLSPLASNRVTFTVVGPATVAGVGNGDPSSHEPDRASSRNAWNGRCMGIIQALSQTGTVKVIVSSPGLKSVTLTLKIVH